MRTGGEGRAARPEIGESSAAGADRLLPSAQNNTDTFSFGVQQTFEKDFTRLMNVYRRLSVVRF